MYQIIQGMDSGCYKTPKCREQHRALVKAVKAIPHDELDVSAGHFYSSGFIRRGQTIVYFSTGDYRMGCRGIVRYAESFKDYTGEVNNPCGADLPEVVERLLTKREAVEA